MRIAIATDGDFVFAHFGRCPIYTLVEIEEGKIVNKKVINNPGHQPGFLPQFLKEQGVDCVIAGGMGPRAQELFAQAGIKVILGVTGSVDDVIKQLLNGTLKEGKSFCEHEHHTQQTKKAQGEIKSATSEKICITSQGNSLDSEVDPRFGRCQYFIIVDPETMEFEAIENPNINAVGGAGVQSAQMLANKGVKVVLTGDVGPNAYQVLQSAGIKIITEVSGLVKDVIEKYKSGDIK